MCKLCKNNQNGLTIAQLQAKLFHKFQYRIDGPQNKKNSK